ncbi:MAG: hypothetical protein WB663_15055, partial [Beijerinckiaceae bacterium]
HEDPTTAVAELVDPLEREAIRLVYADPTKPRKLLSDIKEEYLQSHWSALEYGALVLMAKNLIRLPNGMHRYQRRIPKALKAHYSNAGEFIRKNLGRDPIRAARIAAKLTAEHDALWKTPRAQTTKAMYHPMYHVGPCL